MASLLAVENSDAQSQPTASVSVESMRAVMRAWIDEYRAMLDRAGAESESRARLAAVHADESPLLPNRAESSRVADAAVRSRTGRVRTTAIAALQQSFERRITDAPVAAEIAIVLGSLLDDESWSQWDERERVYRERARAARAAHDRGFTEEPPALDVRCSVGVYRWIARRASGSVYAAIARVRISHQLPEIGADDEALAAARSVACPPRYSYVPRMSLREPTPADPAMPPLACESLLAAIERDDRASVVGEAPASTTPEPRAAAPAASVSANRDPASAYAGCPPLPRPLDRDGRTVAAAWAMAGQIHDRDREGVVRANEERLSAAAHLVIVNAESTAASALALLPWSAAAGSRRGPAGRAPILIMFGAPDGPRHGFTALDDIVAPRDDRVGRLRTALHGLAWWFANASNGGAPAIHALARLLEVQRENPTQFGADERGHTLERMARIVLDDTAWAGRAGRGGDRVVRRLTEGLQTTADPAWIGDLWLAVGAELTGSDRAAEALALYVAAQRSFSGSAIATEARRRELEARDASGNGTTRGTP